MESIKYADELGELVTMSQREVETWSSSVRNITNKRNTDDTKCLLHEVCIGMWECMGGGGGVQNLKANLGG